MFRIPIKNNGWKGCLTIIFSLSKNKVMSAKISGDKLRGHLETMILSVLESGSAHGLGIIQRLESSGCGALRLKEGSLYPALYRMEKAGLIKSAWEENTTGRRGPGRRVYRITPKGTRQLSKGRMEWQSFVSVIGAIVGTA